MFGNSSIKQQIIKHAVEYSGNKLFEGFVDAFYSYIPTCNDNSCDINEFTKIGIFVFQELINKRNNICLVEALKDKASVSEDVIVALINDDTPFIVDSIAEYLTKKKYKVKHMINALLAVDRDVEGNIKSINKIDQLHKSNESAIYINLSLPNQGEHLKKLSDELIDVLAHVRVSCMDWKVMLWKVNDILYDTSMSNESKELLKWIQHGNFTFIGYQDFCFHGKNHIVTESLGIAKLEKVALRDIILSDVFESNYTNMHQVAIGKISSISKVHRRTNLDYISVSKSKNGKLVSAQVFVGLFSSRLEYQSITQIPVIRLKVDTVIKKAGFNDDSFNQKELFSIIETLPRDELFQLSVDELFLISMKVLSSLHHPRVLFFSIDNKCKSFMNLLVFFPRSRVTSDIVEKVRSVIQHTIKGKYLNSALRFSIMGLAYIHISMKVSNNKALTSDIDQIEQKLDEITRRWDEDFSMIIEKEFGIEKADKIFDGYKSAFPTNYQLCFSVQDAIEDIKNINQILDGAGPLFSLCQRNSHYPRQFSLKTYNVGAKLDLHKIMPIIENVGFLPIEENVFKIHTDFSGKPVLIQDFSLVAQENHDLASVKDNIESVIRAVFNNQISNDPINQLALKAGLSWREIFLIDAYCRYMLQIKFTYSQSFIRVSLVRNSTLTKLIVALFHSMFDDKTDGKETKSAILKKIKLGLSKVANNSEDKVLHKLVELVTNTLRTNFFQKSEDGSHKNYISFKLNSRHISDLPKPNPYAEIFVYSAEMEGIHLRGGKISRGGIRWSDRIDDYRTEVLGLMKAQTTKNVIIIPDGAKGGFLVKNQDQMNGQDEVFEAGVRCYQTLLRGMFDITDNIISGKLVKPRSTICLDEDDPYLVVAADKGTATFSDIANALSKEYNFWLGDAFASGGEFGYDHKKIGITARGAWISVKEHFSKIDINPEEQNVTVVGIGDMSGDVFGNGMLLSKTMKLVAAFNHLHIFIDPNPNPEISFNERKRLFNMPRSKWTDYNINLISKGGGVFERNSKSIRISREIMALLSITSEVIDPDSLVKSILTAKVDLLWNGGIGTYVKAESEVNEQIWNKSNDSVRVNGKDLRCKVVCEGGNLGVTQLGRVEYNFNGGMINTDFIDNSGGVDCSDHEVNIKIALNAAVVDKKITKPERDRLLVMMQSEVAQLVLNHNITQDQSISIASMTSSEHFGCHTRLIELLHESVGLDLALEFLPSKSELARRSNENIGFSRPELAVLSAYSKMATYKSLIDSALPDNAYYEKFLLGYFPTKMRSSFERYIKSHQLKKEIIATLVANNIVDHTGLDFIHLAQDYTGFQACDIARAYSVVWEIFDLGRIWSEVEGLKNNLIKTQLFADIRIFLNRVIFWLLRNKPQPIDVAGGIEYFQSGIQVLFAKAESLLVGMTKDYYQEKVNEYTSNRVSMALASKIGRLVSLYSVMDIVEVSKKSGLDVVDAGKAYFMIGDRLYYNWLRMKVDSLPRQGYLDRMLVKSLQGDICDQQRDVVLCVLESPGVKLKEKISYWEKDSSKEIAMFISFVQSIQSLQMIDPAKLVVAIKRGAILLN